jgi:glycosyltransferase involved in cell wall biosynthesis
MKKKILIITGILPPDIGGPALFTENYCKWLKKKNYKVEILTLGDKKFYKKNNITIINRNAFFLFRFIKTVIAIINRSKKYKIILVNGLHLETSFATFFSKSIFYFRVAGDKAWEFSKSKKITNLSFDEFQMKNNFFTLFLKFLRNLSLRRSSAIIVPSKYLKKIVINWNLNKKVYQINNSALIERNRNTKIKKNKKFIITSVARLVDWKNLRECIDAVKYFKNIEYNIIGDGPLLNYFKNYIHINGLNNKIILHGKKNHKYISKIMHKSSVFLLISSYEGMSHVILDAMKLKIPLVISHIPPNKEVIKHNSEGLMVNLKKKNDLLNKLKYLHKNQNLLNFFSNKAFKKYNKFFKKEINFSKYDKLIFNSKY